VKQAPHPLPIFGSLWFALHLDFKQNPEDLPATPQVLALLDVPRALLMNPLEKRFSMLVCAPW
jgi:hypothetical protein